MYSNDVCLDLEIYIAPTRRSDFYLYIPMGVHVTQCSVIRVTAEGAICVPVERKRERERE